MAYQSWSVVFGEQPSAAKWNILGTNDSSFNDGTGIFGLYKNLLAVDSNPYKFSVWRAAAQTINTGGFTTIGYDTELYDTNSNFAASTYTAPVAGFYLFIVGLSWQATASLTRMITDIYKNGVEISRSSDVVVTSSVAGSAVSVVFLQLAASDAITVRGQPVGANTALDVSSSAFNYFMGFLVCRT